MGPWAELLPTAFSELLSTHPRRVVLASCAGLTFLKTTVGKVGEKCAQQIRGSGTSGQGGAYSHIRSTLETPLDDES